MKIEIEVINVMITREEAFDIINIITKATSPVNINPEYPKAVEFSGQLRNIFMNHAKGIHFK